jgi:predicted dehydrogenase
MAMNSKEAASMVAAAEAADRRLCVSHNFLFSRSVRKADKILGASPDLSYAFGAQLSSVGRRLPTWYENLPGGLFFDECPHLIYTLQHFLGALSLEDCRVTWQPSRRHPKSVEIQLRGDRAIGQLFTLFDSPVSEWHVGLVTSSSVLVLDLFRDILVSFGQDAEHKPLDIMGTSLQVMLGHARGFVASGARYATRRLFWGHEAIIHAFVDAALGLGPVPVDPRESVQVVRLTDDILRAMSPA